MFESRFVDRSPVIFQPRVAPEPELQERLEERIRIVSSQLRRPPRHQPWPGFGQPPEQRPES